MAKIKTKRTGKKTSRRAPSRVEKIKRFQPEVNFPAPDSGAVKAVTPQEIALEKVRPFVDRINSLVEGEEPELE